MKFSILILYIELIALIQKLAESLSGSLFPALGFGRLQADPAWLTWQCHRGAATDCNVDMTLIFYPR